MEDEKRRYRLVELLHARAAEGKLRWEKTLEPGVYLTALPEHGVTIEQWRPGLTYTGPLSSSAMRQMDDASARIAPRVRVSIRDTEGHLIDEFDQGDFTDDTRRANAQRMLERTYTIARDQALGADGSFDRLLHALSS